MPKAIVVNGNSFSLNTDYRVWIRFYKDLEKFMNNKNLDEDISYLFSDTVPIIDKDIFEQLVTFLHNNSITPKQKGGGGEKVMDYYLDGDYIFSALYAVYGIDITEIDMHWQKFKSLVDNVIGDNTLFGFAKGARGYKRKSKNNDSERDRIESKEAWALPIEKAEEDTKEMDEFIAYFGGGNE